MLLGALLLTFLMKALSAQAAEWVLIAPPADINGDYFRSAPISGLWSQLAAFDDADQCKEHRMQEIKFWEGYMVRASDGLQQQWLRQRWTDEFFLRCMPYDLWTRLSSLGPD